METFANMDDRFWTRVEKTESGCWLWLGPVHKEYGRCKRKTANGQSMIAHRVAYMLAIGPIPAGMQIDHLCRNKLCVNPTHLEPVDGLTNVRRAIGARSFSRTHCARGHEYKDGTFYTWLRPGRNVPVVLCLICKREEEKRFKWVRRRDRKEVSRG